MGGNTENVCWAACVQYTTASIKSDTEKWTISVFKVQTRVFFGFILSFASTCDRMVVLDDGYVLQNDSLTDNVVDICKYDMWLGSLLLFVVVTSVGKA